MLNVDDTLRAESFRKPIGHVFELATPKIGRIDSTWQASAGAPVVTVRGRYTARGWTEWTQGFQFGCALLVYDATDNADLFRLGRKRILESMAPHLTHFGVHDHGFNTLSTYGHLLRFMREGRTVEGEGMRQFYELAVRVSAAVQAARWSTTHDGTGFIHSFNGAHSLFSDTIRSCRVLILGHQLGHRLMGENDVVISLLQRAYEHVLNTARYNVYYGENRDIYDVRGRVAHESIFNMADGRYRCPSTQQGYSPFTTWMRGLAWIMLGSAELLECIAALPDDALDGVRREDFTRVLERMACATCDFYIENTPPDGIPYWDTGAPGLAHMPGHLDEPAEPDNPLEPVDSSAGAIAAQGLLRLGKYLEREERDGHRYHLAGLTTARTLLSDRYLAEDPDHDGLLLHSVYHRPNGWDHVPKDSEVPQGESSMWGDYHLLELALYLHRQITGAPYYAFFPQPGSQG